MPYFFENPKHRLQLPEDKDRRRKLPKCEHRHIRERYKQGESQRQLARAYRVSRRLIVFILYPKRQEINTRNAKKRGQSRKSYEKEKGSKWNARAREARKRKYQLLKKSNLQIL